MRDVFYFGVKPNVHPKERFAIDLDDARRQAISEHFWIVHDLCDYNGFDWEIDILDFPDSEQWAFEHDNVWPSQHQKDSGTWLCPKEKGQYIVYRNDVEPVKRRNIKTDNWIVLESIDETNFDFSWHPDCTSPSYIYAWGCKYYPVEVKPVVEYHVAGATDYKYMNEMVELLPNKDNWKILEDIDESSFDFSWRPDPREPPYIYAWGCKYYPVEVKPVVEYHVAGATDYKYMNEMVELLPKVDRWQIVREVDKSSFDFSWRPDVNDPPFIYVFGNTQYPGTVMPTLKYVVPDATQEKYVHDVVAKLAPHKSDFQLLEKIDEDLFDFSWVPDPNDPPYIYAWGNQYNDPTVKISVKYVIPGATEYKYMSLRVTRKPCMDNWEVPANTDISNFDFSWEPDMRDPPYIYQFYTEIDKSDGPRYICPNNDGTVVYKLRSDKILSVNKYYITTTLDDLVEKHKNEVFWACRQNIDYTDFDFEWLPDKVDLEYELNYVHVFGSKESELTQTYFVSADHYLSGNKNYKFVSEVDLSEDTYGKIFVKPDIFFVDKNNIESTHRYSLLRDRFNERINKTRYVNNIVDTINRCANKSKTELFYVLDSELDYTDFDFDYYPNPWQMKMVHVFGTQHNHWGTTYLVNKESFAHDTRYIKKIEHLSSINLVRNKKATATNCLYDVLLIDHGNTELDQVQDTIKNRINGKNVTIVKYRDSYLNTLKTYISSIAEKKDHYLYVCSSVCDYTDFDFTYVADPFAREQLHVFPSNGMKYGDTFLIDVNKCRTEFDTITRLEEYDKINFNYNNQTRRFVEPVIYVDNDTHVDSLVDDYHFPYARYVSNDNRDVNIEQSESVNMWSMATQEIVIQSSGATSILVPRNAKNIVDKELYDYPYIKKINILSKSKPLDIVFLSNGESIAKHNYDRLRELTSRTNNRVVHVEGVNGRMNAYHAAAKASETPWMFTVFAKLEVDENFDWDWQPDRMQVSKHYIFHALNPVNKLVYGHQAMIAYNKRLVLNNTGRGLDFTLDDEHEVIPLLSGIARYNTDEFTTWRTSFREVIKLQCNTDNDSKNRLTVWLTEAQGDYAEYSLRGANDAVRYYQSVDGDFDQLKLSYEWDWLRERFRLTSNLI